jgi:RHH-type transcriptional regulator, proline utilization regulon repressor / proline dehydrogenase / delta 1-pyrroline-5-carboxylate dehydrogenase
MYWKKTELNIEDFSSIVDNYTFTESTMADQLVSQLDFFLTNDPLIGQLARRFTLKTRELEQDCKGMASLVQHYDLSTEEGIVLMCVAEALLRIPDVKTEKRLIADKLSAGNWKKHLGQGSSTFVNLTTWGLSVSGKILSTPDSTKRFKAIWHNMIKKTSEGVIRQAVRRTIKWMSEEFVLGRHIDEALKRGRHYKKQGYTFSFDMLGEAAMTQADADHYFMAYADAIEKLAKHIDDSQTIFQRPGISVKLSALYPRYEFSHQHDAIAELSVKLKQLALRARDLNIALTVDAEEADRLDMSLSVFKNVFCDAEFSQWEGLGLAIQAYQKRASAVCQWIIDLANKQERKIQVRLVKGAYWDTEIKQAQMLGWDDYPVFTRKETTDVNYLLCAQMLVQAQEFIYPKFATHNAYTVAAILTFIEKSGLPTSVEFQNLQGMGKSLHQQILERGIACRIYAPVGSHQELLPYLVRRLLENGANSSFVNQIGNEDIPIDDLIANPVKQLQLFESKQHDKIPLPQAIFKGRVNSSGVNWTNLKTLKTIQDKGRVFDKKVYSVVSEEELKLTSKAYEVYNPACLSDHVGRVIYATDKEIQLAFDKVKKGRVAWQSKDVDERASMMESFADSLEEHRVELIRLLQREAGKVMVDAIDEIREAVDFCRYYAAQSRQVCAPTSLSGYTGETDVLILEGRGTVACISPWNFPVAIFIGQIVAALVVGNTVIAKPAEQTSLIAHRVLELFYQAGLPEDVLVLLHGKGEKTGAAIINHPDVSAVMFTGSTQTAQLINQTLAAKKGPITPLIAETGGINAMLVDSSALLEQVTRDVVRSAFGSAGQRCSALRVLLIQEDVADAAIEMISGAMALLEIGDPSFISTDIGPVIDDDAKQLLLSHITKLKSHSELLYECKLPSDLQGHYVVPTMFEIKSLDILTQEVFGPVLHVLRFKRDDMLQVIDQLNQLGYGLTFGVHSRIDSTIDEVKNNIQVGNVYVNRNTIGAVVGLQPFGGCRLSGTGPKAGGPHYLARLCSEKVISTDTTAAGGNASLMALSSDEKTD